MHLVPYLKSKINPSANDEMNKITLPSKHRIRNSSPDGLRSITLPLMEAPVLLPILTSDLYEWAGKKAFSETWMPERGTNPRYPDFLSRPLYYHCISCIVSSVQVRETTCAACGQKGQWARSRQCKGAKNKSKWKKKETQMGCLIASTLCKENAPKVTVHVGGAIAKGVIQDTPDTGAEKSACGTDVAEKTWCFDI